MIDPNLVVVGLAGAGEGLARRQALLAEAGIAPVSIAADARDEALQGLAVLFVAGLPLAEATALAARARLAGIFVNVEDAPALCDFHVPAVIRRGDLVISVSTGGKAPGLARLIREWLGRRLGVEWGARLADVAEVRAAWREAGHSPAEVAARTRAHVAERAWLP